MENAPTILREPQPPPFPAPSRTVDLSPLEFILSLLAFVTVPALIYAFFFAVKCPPWPSRRRRSSDPEPDNAAAVKPDDEETVSSGVKYQKESHVKDIGSECPVCLSVFSDGEQVKQLSACNHSFHATCIDMWLNSHSNCPVCRASVGQKGPNNGTAARLPRPRVDNDRHQGLPDASSLV